MSLIVHGIPEVIIFILHGPKQRVISLIRGISIARPCPYFDVSSKCSSGNLVFSVRVNNLNNTNITAFDAPIVRNDVVTTAAPTLTSTLDPY